MKKIAVLTSGGGAPGMNAAIRAVVGIALRNGAEVHGIRDGYAGLIAGDFLPMGMESIDNMMHLGGTILGSTRSDTFKLHGGQHQALASLKERGMDGLVVIGGNGSMQGAQELNALGFPTVGIPATISNDVSHTDYTVGFDTAVNNVVKMMDKILDLSSFHERTYVFEVMGPNAANIARRAGESVGASFIITSADHYDELMFEHARQALQRGDAHTIVVLAEGIKQAKDMDRLFKEKTGFDHTWIMVMEQLQRGGSPTGYDRIMSSRMGELAVRLLIERHKGGMVGWKNGQLIHVPFKSVQNVNLCLV